MQVHIPLYDPATLLLLAVFSTPDKVGWPAPVLVLRLLICLAATAGLLYCAGQGICFPLFAYRHQWSAWLLVLLPFSDA